MNDDDNTSTEPAMTDLAGAPDSRHKTMAARSSRGERTAAGQLPAQRRSRRTMAMLRGAHRKPRAKR